eukprot:4835486-Alexandrium_andersonii.AAC.1
MARLTVVEGAVETAAALPGLARLTVLTRTTSSPGTRRGVPPASASPTGRPGSRPTSQPAVLPMVPSALTGRTPWCSRPRLRTTPGPRRAPW